LSAYLGWAATGVVVASYFFKGQRTLRGVQMLGAAMWMIYGVTIEAMPVIAANILVLAAAAWTMKRNRSLDRLSADSLT
jgi:thiol:disulfide interchange protein